VFQQQDKREKYASRNIRPTVKHGGGVSQMIWACFISDKLGPIVFIEGMVNQDTYQRVLKEHLIPFLDALKADEEVDLEFQQDNARPHTAKRTKKLLQELAEKNGLKIMEWPPNSPDLNPIEHLWVKLKLELFRRYPDTISLKGSSYTVRAVLQQRLHEIWWNIGEDVLKRQIESMPHRVKEVLTARGWYTSY
jgi:transposase